MIGLLEPKLTVESAKALLTSRPLKFGDPDQIKAVEFLSAIESMEVDGVLEALRQCRKQHRKKCSKCDGEGTCWHCDAECGDCDGEGYTDTPCKCMDGFPESLVEAAEDELENEK